jgi:hypothetical protein
VVAGGRADEAGRNRLPIHHTHPAYRSRHQDLDLLISSDMSSLLKLGSDWTRRLRSAATAHPKQQVALPVVVAVSINKVRGRPANCASPWQLSLACLSTAPSTITAANGG